ncbi:ABC transporter ATP-binding protein [Amycolatopsis rubida]|uniref:Iron complex transport system ATP-binding protein n=1 Tax=Amycolatopsis rubida TaxID=112413 RepID=A0A1I5HQM6_9PSEU|nr:ABC transporter ATP-binding protein [Amycolatopsis rubida]SFO50602.1 iron complex transport system ATP-binding protein [Amycolatopsis rubida]
MDLTLHVERLGFGYGRTPVLREVTLPEVRAPEVTAIVGPNGSGKSTLLRCVAGFHRVRGQVRLSGRAAGERQGSGGILYLPQDPPPPSSLTVFEAVLVARKLGGAGGGGEHDARVAATLLTLGLDGLATRRLSDLSGGQRQMVGLAQAMTRRPDVLLLDEPTSNLDLRNQLRVLRLVRDLARDQPAAVVAVVHDLSLAARIADRIVVLHEGTVHSAGSPAEVITAEMLGEVYQVEGTVQHAANGVLTVAIADSL